MPFRTLCSCVLLLVLTTCAVACAEDRLLGHWAFDELVDGVAPDASGHDRHGKVFGEELVDGVHGNAIRFNGVDQYVALGNLGEHQAVTVAFWMKPEQPEAAEPADDNGGVRCWQGLVTSDAWEAGVLHVPFGRRIVDAYYHQSESDRGRLESPRLRYGQWYHVAIVADTASRELRLFLNGQEHAYDRIDHYTGPIKLMEQVVGREGDGRYFRGAIDDVRIYGTALSPAQVAALCPAAVPVAGRDPRNYRHGLRIPSINYCDQPYIVITKDGNWLCTLTTGAGHEGVVGQHVVSTISTDRGRTWSPLVEIEPPDGPEASWVVPLVTPYGRVYAFYTYNGDDVRTLPGETKPIRSDTHGWYAYRYSDDHGHTWSAQRYRLPMRVTAADRGNQWKGEVQTFWGIDKPTALAGRTLFAFTKLGRYFLEQGEGWVFYSDNLLEERDPEKLRWELRPTGEHGIRHPDFGSVQEEHNLVPLDEDGRLYMVYRTTQGYPAHTYSDDWGKTWTLPQPMTYTPDGRRIKNPRACPKLWKAANGKYLFWYHNHNGKDFRGRNPAWIVGGELRDGKLHWSQPEILLYDPEPSTRMSYPDLIEQDGRYWVTETQKTVARVHEIDSALFEGLWNQGKVREVARDGLLLECGPGDAPLPGKLGPESTGGLTVDIWLTLENTGPGGMLVDTRDAKGRGLALTTTDDATVRLELSDGKTQFTWDCDAGVLQPGKRHHVVAIVDAGPQIVSFIVDGQFRDGGPQRQFGWGRYAEPLGDVTGGGTVRVAPVVEKARLYDRYLRTSEAVGNYHAGL